MTAAAGVPDLWELTADGRGLRLNLHAGQQRAWDAGARFLLVVAGLQSGKTSFGPVWLHREIQRRGPGDYLVGSATYDLLQLKMLPELLRLFVERLRWGVYRADRRVIESHDGRTRIILRSADSESGLESATAKAAWLDEWGMASVPVEAWDGVVGRLALHMGRALITTLGYTLGWLYQQVYVRAVGGDADYAVVSFRSIDNPAFPRAEWERARATLPAWKFRMRYGGEFVRPAGLIYGDYDEAVHLVRAFPIPKAWLRVVGVDFGAVNTALVWLAEEMEGDERQAWPTGRYYAYREQHGLGLTGPEYAKQALEYGEPVRVWAGGTKSEGQAREEWQLAGCPVSVPEVLEVEPGIDRVIGLFREKRLFVFEHLTGLRSELGTYSREVDPGTGEPLEKIADKERFHRLDALRYAVSMLPVGARERPRPVPGKGAADLIREEIAGFSYERPRERDEWGA